VRFRDQLGSAAFFRSGARFCASLGILLAGAAWAASASAAPQWHGSLQPGIAGVGHHDAFWQRTVFHGAMYADVLLGRESSNDLGIGPFVSCGTEAFSDLRLAIGPTLLLPVSPFVTQVSLGTYAVATTPHAWGLRSQLFLGGRSYNHYASYSSAIGLVLGVDYGLGERKELVASAAVALDLAYLALPFLVLYGALQPNE
jgi:hypothetical protein